MQRVYGNGVFFFFSGVDESLHREGKDRSLYICTSAASFLLCLFMFYFISPRFSSLVLSGYNELPHAKKIDWDTR